MTSLCRLRPPGAPTIVDDIAGPVLLDDRLRAVLSPDARLLSLYEHGVFCEGPVWWPARGVLVWSDIEGRRVMSWHPDGCVDVLIDATPFINGNAVDHDGTLLHCEHGRRAISWWPGTGPPVIMAAHYQGRRLNSPNDLVVAHDGAIWFTDPTFGIRNPAQGCPAEPELAHRSVYRYDRRSDTLTRMADMEQPNGLAFSPDGGTLYVSDTADGSGGHTHEIYAFDVAADGALSRKRIFRVIEPGVPDGFCVDARGWVWSSSGDSVQVFSAEGEPLGRIPTPHTCSNCAFGGVDGRRLFITGEESLWAIDLIG
jgi:gluconolactonase